MEIPITISIQGNTAELERDLLGLGEKTTNPDIIKILGKDFRETNTTAIISDGITLGHPTLRPFKKAMESFYTGFEDVYLALFITEQTLNLGIHAYAIAVGF